jgi:hypothetical protein
MNSVKMILFRRSEIRNAFLVAVSIAVIRDLPAEPY